MKKNTSLDPKSKQFAEVLKENCKKNGAKINKARLHLIAMVIVALCKVQTVSLANSIKPTFSFLNSVLKTLLTFLVSINLLFF